jgi:hypothetical protein
MLDRMWISGRGSLPYGVTVFCWVSLLMRFLQLTAFFSLTAFISRIINSQYRAHTALEQHDVLFKMLTLLDIPN